MYLRCRPSSNAHEFKEVGSSSFSSLAIQHRHRRRRFSQHPRPQPHTQQKREARQRARQSPTSRRLFHSTSTLPNAQYNTAVIGGGITGLTAAYKISRDPNAKVTLYESSSKLGGWMKETERVKVDGGDVLFEYGPRSFRVVQVKGYSTSNLLLDLDLKDQVLFTAKDMPAARNRYIYHRGGLLRLPMSSQPLRNNPLGTGFSVLANVLSEPLFRHILWQAIKDWFGYKSQGRKRGGDESISDFISRKFSPRIVDDLFSAFVHGIYAGDPDKLSFKTHAYEAWFIDQKSSSFFKGLLQLAGKGLIPIKSEDHDAVLLALKDRAQVEESGRVDEIQEMTKDIGSFVLKGGMVQLVDRLREALADAKNAEVKTNVQIEKISGSYKSPMEVRLADGSSQTFDHVISTTSPSQLAKQIQGPSDAAPSPANDTVRELSSGPDYAVNVMVVNLFYEKSDLLPVEGFGYLIPRSTPLSQNPERALGVIFGSETESTRNTAQGTNLTVMLGGHWWDGWKEGDFPDEQSAIEMGRNLVKRHLNISETPSVARARLQRNAIPQPTVGHHDRMGRLDGAILRDYGDNLKVGGAWYTGISINDCIRAGSMLGLRLRHREDEGRSSQTGLGMYSAQEGFNGILRLVNLKKFWMSMALREKGIEPPPEGLKPTQKKG